MIEEDQDSRPEEPEREKARGGRDSRLAEALRANLRKRKAQARARRERSEKPQTQED